MNYRLQLFVIVFLTSPAASLALDKITEKAMGELMNTQGTSVFPFLVNCSQVYGLSAINTVRDSIEQTRHCLERIFYPDLGGRILVISHPTTSASVHDTAVDDAITTLCNNFKTDLQQCLKLPLRALKSCTSDQGDADLDAISNAASAAVDYACHGGGDNIVKFVSQNGPQCLKGVSREEIIDCVRLRESLLVEIEHNRSVFNPDKCRIHWESNKCVVNVIERCTNRSATAKRIVQGLINAAMNQTSCPLSTRNAMTSGSQSHHIVDNRRWLVLIISAVLPFALLFKT